MSKDSAQAADPDQRLLSRWSRDGDQRAFTEFVERHLGMVRGAAFRRLGRPELADEVAQYVFAMAGRRARALAEHPCIGAWLHRTAVLESANVLRRERKQQHLAETMAEQHERPDPPATTNTRILDHLDDALGSLPEFQRQILLLRFAEGLSFGQIGRRVGKSADACQKHASRALELLRSRLTRRTAGITIAALTATLSTALQTPASGASAISKLALASSSTIPTQKVLIYSLLLMKTSTRIAIAVAAIALIGTIPFVMQSTNPRQVVTEDDPAVEAPISPSEAQPLAQRSTDESQRLTEIPALNTPTQPKTSTASSPEQNEPHFVAAWDEMIHARMNGSISPKEPFLWQALKDMKPDEVERIIAEFEAANFPAEIQGGFLANMLGVLANKCPPDFLVRRFAGYAASGNPGVTMSITATMCRWVKADPEGARQWFNAQSNGGILESTRLDDANPVRELLQKVLDDPDAAAEAQGLPPAIDEPESESR